jgi:phosphatidate cytidylyltransferase
MFSRISQWTLEYALPLIFFLYIAGFVAFILSLRKDSLRYQFSQLTWTLLTLLLIVGQTHFCMQYLFQGIIWILLPHGLSIVNDIMAYFCGITMGRKLIDRPLFALSPNKTWEGFIGAMFFTIAFAFFISPLFIQSDWIICPAGLYDAAAQKGCDVDKFDHGYIFVLTKYNIPYFSLSDLQMTTKEVLLYPLQLHAISFALFASLIAPFGGFLASSIKRAFNKKDFHNIFPGHGGFMDRVDCQLLTCSFVYIYLNTFIKGSATTVEAILSQIELLNFEQQTELMTALQAIIQTNKG